MKGCKAKDLFKFLHDACLPLLLGGHLFRPLFDLDSISTCGSSGDCILPRLRSGLREKPFSITID